MKIWYNNILDFGRSVASNVRGDVRIGRARDNDIVLDSPFVADKAAVLRRKEPNWEIVPLGRNGCTVNQREMLRGQTAVVAPGGEFLIFPYRFVLEADDETPAGGVEPLQHALNNLVHDVHRELIKQTDAEGLGDKDALTDEAILAVERSIEAITRSHDFWRTGEAELIPHAAGRSLRDEIVDRILDPAYKAGDASRPRARWSRLVSRVPEREDEVESCVRSVAGRLHLAEDDDISRQMARLEEGFWPAWEADVSSLFGETLAYLALQHVKKQVKDLVFGYGPLEDLLRAPNISEIMVVDRDKIFIEKNGVIEDSGRKFISDEVTETIIQRMVARVNRRIDRTCPLVDARLEDGSRVNAIIAPLAVSGPSLTIRRFPYRPMSIDDLIRLGTVNEVASTFLRAAVVARANILISGGTGTGKTTLLNCLANFIPEKERIVTVEDTAELQISRRHLVRLETRQQNVEGAGEYTIRDLVRNALRMRPDRILVGECRGGEAVDMLQAMNTGHDGSLTTVHANSAQDAIGRLEVMVQSVQPIPLSAIQRQISAAFDLIIQLDRARGGARRIVQIAELLPPVPGEEGLRIKALFIRGGSETTDQLVPTGRLPTFLPELIHSGLLTLESFFLPEAAK